MKSELLDTITDVGSAAVQLEAGVGRVKQTVTDAVEDGIKTASRAVKRGRRAAEDMVDDAEYQVKHHPLGTVGISFSIGLGLGAVAGMLLARNRDPGKRNQFHER
jgi:ElaB/YqjD/DUF883 family membrane-anchored ribosome-binding protein